MRDLDNLNEADINIEGKSPFSEEALELYAKNQLTFDKFKEYWLPLYRQGKTCMDFMHGKIFDDATRHAYEEIQKKLCVEPRILKTRMNALAGHVTKGEKSGRVISEGGGDSEEDYRANVILKYLEQNLDLNHLLKQAVLAGVTTGFPQVFEYTMSEDPMGNQEGLEVEWLKWDRVVVTPGFLKPDGSDIKEYIKFSRKTIAELKRENPEKKEEINEMYKNIKDRRSISSTISGVASLSIEDQRNLEISIEGSSSRSRADGRLLVYDRVFPVLKKVKAFVNKSGDSTIDFQQIPDNWDEKREKKWIEKNPEYEKIETEIPVLWHCRWTQEGLMLRNKQHWFQEYDRKGMPVLPIATYVPQIIDGVPSAPGPDDIPLVQMKAVAETEFLHDIRMGSGDILAFQDGAVKNAEDLPTELSISNGIVSLDETKVNGNISEYVQFLKRTPNTNYGDYAEKIERELDKTDLMHESMQGQHAPNQSGKAKGMEISQAMLGYHMVVNNYNKTYERLKNLQCMMIPYAFTEEQTIQIWDEERQEQSEKIEVNKKEYDMNGNEVIVENDLTAAKWRWKLVDSEDSATAREQELNEMLMFWNTAAPPLIEADSSMEMLSSVLKSMSNKMAKELGGVIAEKANARSQELSQQEMAKTMAEVQEKQASAQAKLESAEKAGFQFSITAEDLMKFPEIYNMLVDGGYINRNQGDQFQLPQGKQQRQMPQQGGQQTQMPSQGMYPQGQQQTQQINPEMNTK